MSYFWATATPVVDFWLCLLWVSKTIEGFLICIMEMNKHSLRFSSGTMSTLCQHIDGQHRAVWSYRSLDFNSNSDGTYSITPRKPCDRGWCWKTHVLHLNHFTLPDPLGSPCLRSKYVVYTLHRPIIYNIHLIIQYAISTDTGTNISQFLSKFMHANIP